MQSLYSPNPIVVEQASFLEPSSSGLLHLPLQTLDAAALQQVAALELGVSLTFEQCEALIEELDTDHDGLITTKDLLDRFATFITVNKELQISDNLINNENPQEKRYERSNEVQISLEWEDESSLVNEFFFFYCLVDSILG
jgi:pyruvate formate-lyase activating enzyme-like uncharacterized protein